MPELDVTLHTTGKRSCLIHFGFFDIIICSRQKVFQQISALSGDASFQNTMWAKNDKRHQMCAKESVSTKIGILNRTPIIEIIFHHGGSVLWPLRLCGH